MTSPDQPRPPLAVPDVLPCVWCGVLLCRADDGCWVDVDTEPGGPHDTCCPGDDDDYDPDDPDGDWYGAAHEPDTRRPIVDVTVRDGLV